MPQIDDDPRSKPGLSAAPPSRLAVQRLRSLAPLPQTSQILLQMLSDPDLDILRLAEIVEQTPALAARILGVANSAFFASSAAVRDVPDAIIRVLGLNLVRDLSTSFALSQPFDLSQCRRFDAMRYWTSAMESAVLTQMIVSCLTEADSPTPAEAYLGGLLHNLGLLVLVHVAPEAMDQVFANKELEPSESLKTFELTTLGLDHSAAGAELAIVWRLPSLLAVAMGPSSTRPLPRRDRIMMQVLELCLQVRRCLKAGTDPDEDPFVLTTSSEIGLTRAARAKTVARWQARSEDIADLATAFLGKNR